MFVKIHDPKGNVIDGSKLIEKVRYGLHPSFGVDYQDIKAGAAPNFEMSFAGWGTFEVPT